jgi:hypothetical protein
VKGLQMSREVCITHLVIKDTHDPWTIFDNLNIATNNKAECFKYGTPRQFKYLPIKTVDPNDGNFTLIMRVKIHESENLPIVVNTLQNMKNCGEIGKFELHSETYTYKDSLFCHSV